MVNRISNKLELPRKLKLDLQIYFWTFYDIFVIFLAETLFNLSDDTIRNIHTTHSSLLARFLKFGLIILLIRSLPEQLSIWRQTKRAMTAQWISFRMPWVRSANGIFSCVPLCFCSNFRWHGIKWASFSLDRRCRSSVATQRWRTPVRLRVPVTTITEPFSPRQSSPNGIWCAIAHNGLMHRRPFSCWAFLLATFCSVHWLISE